MYVPNVRVYVPNVLRKVQVEARYLLCYWAVRELGISCTDLAKQLEMSQPGVGYAVSRGKNR